MQSMRLKQIASCFLRYLKDIYVKIWNLIMCTVTNFKRSYLKMDFSCICPILAYMVTYIYIHTCYTALLLLYNSTISHKKSTRKWLPIHIITYVHIDMYYSPHLLVHNYNNYLWHEIIEGVLSNNYNYFGRFTLGIIIIFTDQSRSRLHTSYQYYGNLLKLVVLSYIHQSPKLTCSPIIYNIYYSLYE